MGFFDKLKDVTKSTLDAASKIVDQQTTKEKSNEVTYLNDVICHGSIKGESLPQPKRQGTSLHFSIDQENNNILIYDTIPGMMSSKKQLVSTYSLDDIVEFKHNGARELELVNSVSHSHDNTLVLSSGECFQIYNSIRVDNAPSEFSLKCEIDDWIGLCGVVTTFISKMYDSKTKQWANKFFIDAGGSSIFDENGDLDFADFEAKHKVVLNLKNKEWTEKRKTIC